MDGGIDGVMEGVEDMCWWWCAWGVFTSIVDRRRFVLLPLLAMVKLAGKLYFLLTPNFEFGAVSKFCYVTQPY